MKTKVICLKVVQVPESKAEGARIYYDAHFKRVGNTKLADDETRRVMEEHAHVHLTLGTWEAGVFEAGKEYAVEITPYQAEG